MKKRIWDSVKSLGSTIVFVWVFTHGVAQATALDLADLRELLSCEARLLGAAGAHKTSSVRERTLDEDSNGRR